MSLAYTLFGIPKTFDEFADKATRKGKPVDVYVKSYTNEESHAYCCRVMLQTGRTKLKLDEHFLGIFIRTSPKLGNVFTEDIDAVRDAYNQAIDAAERLQEQGLEVTLFGRPIEETRQALNEVTKALEELQQTYPDYQKLEERCKEKLEKLFKAMQGKQCPTGLCK